MELVRPTPAHLPDFLAALRQGWSPDATRSAEAQREALAQVEADPTDLWTLVDDPDALGAPWKAPDGTVKARIPSRLRWMWDADGFAGSINFRWLPGTTDLPLHVLGHIGYAVVPWKRQRGCATRALGLMLPLARSEGLSFVELTTDPDNIASQKVILAHGGQLIGPFDKGPTWSHQPGLRYRITLSP